MALFKAKDGTQIYYKDCGAGKPILFSHGWPLDGDMWDSQLNYLAERGFRAIAFDRRGFGRSDQPWNGYDYDTFASDINDLITTLDLRDVTLVGFSMGGGDVTRYINNYGSERVAGLALVIHGSNDQIVPFESTGKLAAEMIKNATLKVYDNAPHGFALTHQDQLNEDLLAFVKSL